MKLVLALVSVAISSLVACGPSLNGGADDDDGDDDSSSGIDANPADCVNTPEICGGGGDEDCDGLTDCDDADCEGQSGCANCGEIEHPEATLALPDGVMKVSYASTINFTQFGPGQALTDVSLFRGVCVTMEHSWVRDLKVELTCPSGQVIVLHNFGGRNGGEVHAGTPDDTDDIDPVPGVGAEYCWTPTATNPTWLSWADANPAPLFQPVRLPAGDFRSFTPMNMLMGCALNGDWTLRVTDDWPSDNGFIFSWGLRFDPSIVVDCSTWPPIG